MRATITDILRHPTWASGWWEDLPARQPGWLRWLLFEPGQGWLRWDIGERQTSARYDPPEPPEFYVVAPPLRRLCWFVRWGLRFRERASWRECWSDPRDDDRRR